MPANWLEPVIAAQEIPVDGDEKVAALTKKFGVSQQAMMYRLINLGYLSQGS